MTTSFARRSGRVTAVGLLLTGALAAFPSLARGAAPAPSAMEEVAKPTATINRLLADKWKANELQPADRTTDDEFIRRASLDVVGRIATVEEVRAFEKDAHADKRTRLIDRLLASDDYAKHWADLWTVWLLGRPSQPAYRKALHAWLEGQFARNTSYREMVEKLLTATGKASENGAASFILANLGAPVPKGDWAEQGQFDMVPITSRSTRLFLGVQLQCAQCHCHPYNPEWKQEHFWHMNAFFRQVECRGRPLAPAEEATGAAGAELRDNPKFNAAGSIRFEQINGRQARAEPIFLDGRKVGAKDRGTRREALARFVTSHANFPRAFVNRMWGRFFGRGLNQQATVDDFGEHNEVVHPKLLDRLAKDFAQGGYDPKQLIRWICTSDAYQQKSASNASNATADAAPFFSRMALKTMNLDQLLDSLMTAARVPARQAESLKAQLREEWAREGLVDVGFDEVADSDVNIVAPHRQALFLMNSPDIDDVLGRKDSGTVARAMAEGKTAQVADYLYLAALNRHPTPKELELVGQEIDRVKQKGESDLTPLWQDLFWALFNSNEFVLNH